MGSQTMVIRTVVSVWRRSSVQVFSMHALQNVLYAETTWYSTYPIHFGESSDADAAGQVGRLWLMG